MQYDAALKFPAKVYNLSKRKRRYKGLLQAFSFTSARALFFPKRSQGYFPQEGKPTLRTRLLAYIPESPVVIKKPYLLAMRDSSLNIFL